MDSDWTPHPEPMPEGLESQLGPNWPPVPATCADQASQQPLWDIRERFPALAVAGGQIVWTACPDGMLSDASCWRAYTGQSSDDVRGLGWLDAIHPEDRERARADWLRAVGSPHTYEAQFRLRRADGGYHPFLVRAVPLLDAAGTVREWVGISTDISTHKPPEAPLQASEAHFRATFEHAPVGIGNATLEGQWFDVNQRLCDMLGFTREELLTRTFQDVTHPDDLNASLEPYQQLLAGARQSYTLEKRYLRKDGSPLWVNVTISLVRTALGTPYHTIGIIEDISERKQLKEALQASETHFRALFERAPVGIGQTNQRGRWVSVNQHLCDMLGYTREELLARSFQDITHPDDLEASLHLARQLWTGTSPALAMEKRYLRKDGSPLWVNVTISLVRTPEGKFLYTVAIIEDISQRKQLEEDRTRLLEREQQARAQAEANARRLLAIQVLTDTALEHLAPEDLLRELLDRIREVLAVDATTILLLSPDGQFLTVHASRGLEREGAIPPRIPFGKGIAGRIAASQEPLILDEVSNVEAARPFLAEQLRSLMGVPLLVKGRVIGVLHVGTTRPHRFTQDDVHLLEMVAQRIALAIDHAHLFQAEQQARAEAAARASQLEATIEAMTEGVGIYTPEGHALLTNRSGRTILGIDAPDRSHLFTSHPHAERIALLHCRDRDGNPYPPERSPLTRALQGEVVSDAESEDMLITALDGHKRYLSATAAPIRDVEGQLAGAVFVYRDVTERRLLERRTQEALGALLEMAEALVAPTSSEEPLSVEDAQAGVRAVAQRLAEMAARVLGCERVCIAAVEPETTRLLPLAIVSPDQEEHLQWWGRLRSAPRLGESADPALLERLGAGEVLLLETRVQPFSAPHPFNVPVILLAPMDVGAHLVGLLSIGRDSAESAFAPRDIALAGAVAKLTALVIEREHLLRQREEARASILAIGETNRQLETFLGMASHELKTPLTSILMGQEMLQRRLQTLRRSLTGVSEEAARQVEALQALTDTTRQQGERLNRLVNDLLDTSRIQAGRLSLHMTAVDLARIVRAVVEEQRQVSPERLLILHLPRSGNVAVRADAERVRQVVTNYLTNALKYSAEARPVEVGVHREGRQGRVWVRDQGPGIPESEQARIWERFHRVPGIEIQSGSGVGLGIGLYISKTIIDQHGGQVGVQSTPGQGTTFWFTIPLEFPDKVLQTEDS